MTNSLKPATKGEVILLGSLVAAGLVIGLIQSITWSSRVGWDTVSYLDIADLIRRGNFREALSPYWSPLYPVLIAIAKSFAPALESERSVTCVLQYIFLILYLGASYLFWSRVLEARRSQKSEEAELPRFPQIALMGSLSLLSCLAVGDVAVKGPDMLSAAIYLTANALLISALYQPPSIAKAAQIGCLMGLAYLAKAFFISWAIPCLALLALFRNNYNLKWKHLTALTLAMFATMALYAVPLSIKLGHPSLGESGKYQIVFSSNDRILPMVPMVHGSTNTKHPANIIFKSPVVYEFEKPFDVPYPPWFDPDYWNDGLELKVDWSRYYELLVDKVVSLFFSFMFFFSVLKLGLSLSAKKLVPYSINELKTTSPIWLTATFCSLLYMFMSAAVGRYFMGFIPTMAAAIFLTYRSPGTEPAVRRERRCLWLVTALVLIAFTLKSLMHVYFFAPKLMEAQPEEAHTATVQKLEQLGIKPRDKVMRVARNEGGEYYWAHLADVRVIAECVSPEEFLRMRSTEMEQLDAILRSKGVKAIVLDWTNRKSSDAPPTPTSADWQNVRGTKNFVRLVPQ